MRWIAECSASYVTFIFAILKEYGEISWDTLQKKAREFYRGETCIRNPDHLKIVLDALVEVGIVDTINYGRNKVKIYKLNMDMLHPATMELVIESWKFLRPYLNGNKK